MKSSIPKADLLQPRRFMLGAFLSLTFCDFMPAQVFYPVGDVADFAGQKQAGRLSAIATVPGSASRIFVGASDGGVWRTSTAGTSWTTSTDGKTSLRIRALDTDATGNRVFAATMRPTRLLRSTDGGVSFAELIVPQVAFGSDEIRQILIDPAHANTLYLMTTRGLLRSTDDGNNWEVVFPAVTTHFADAAILSSGADFWVLITKGEILYRSPTGDIGSFAAITPPSPGDGQPPFDGNFGQLLLAPVPGTASLIYLAYAGVNEATYLSTDFGASMSFVSRHPRVLVHSTFVAGADGSTLYSGEHSSGNTSVNRGRNGGLVWDTPFPGPYHADIMALHTTAFPAYLYVATDGGLWRMDENTNPPTWGNLNGNLATLLLNAVYSSRGNSNAIVGGTQDNGAIIHRGAGWKSAVSGDMREGFLLRNNPNIGGIYGSALYYINGDSSTLLHGDTPACPRPTSSGANFSIDPTNPLMVCTASGGRIVCGMGGRDPWCMQSADIDARKIMIVDGNHAWVTTSGGRVLRTSTGILGSWQDRTNNLPVGTIRDLAVAENGDPLRALVLVGTPTQPQRVYETVNGGGQWDPRGIPPVANPGGFPPPCLAPPCSDSPEPGPEVLSFAVTFPGFLRGELWYVGTDMGLLESADLGATWFPAVGVPNVQVNDIGAIGPIVTVGSWGRGAWRATFPTPPAVHHEVAYNDFPFLGHDPVGPIWAGELIDLSGGLIEQVRMVADGGHVFRKGDSLFGPHDFQISPGMPFLTQASGTGQIGFDGPPTSTSALALAPGWNAVGFMDGSPGLASALVVDASTQGIMLGAVLDGAAAVGYLPGGAAPGPSGPALVSTDFPIDPASGYWVYACGQGGLWTPGMSAGSLQVAPAAATTPHASRSAGPIGGTTCPDLAKKLARVPKDLGSSLGGFVLACIPSQMVHFGFASYPICGTPPAVTSDLRSDNNACAAQPMSLGCALTLRVTGINRNAAGSLDVTAEIEANGTATMLNGATCPVNAQTTDALFMVQIAEDVDPPLIDLSLVDSSAVSLNLVQTGCGSDEDAAIAQVVHAAAEAALAQELGLHLAGIGPVCSPDFPLPNADGDAEVDCDDGCPTDGAKVDPGLCGCGSVDDADGDMAAACLGDCDDADGSVWQRPGEVQSLVVDFSAATGQTTISWSPPADAGAVAIEYDTLAAFSPDGFGAAGFCIESDDGTDTTATTTIDPGPGQTLFILTRAENGCPLVGMGTLGDGPGGAERPGRSCP